MRPEIWLRNETRRLRRRNLVKWVDRLTWTLIGWGIGYLSFHLVILAAKQIRPVWFAFGCGLFLGASAGAFLVAKVQTCKKKQPRIGGIK